MVNRVTLVGHLGKDPELRRLEGGIAKARLSMATAEHYVDKQGVHQQQTEWHEVVLWRQMAERAEQQLRKGMLIYVEGKLSTRIWQDRENVSHKTTEVVGSYLRILTRPHQQSEQDQRPEPPQEPGAGAKQLGDFLSSE